MTHATPPPDEGSARPCAAGSPPPSRVVNPPLIVRRPVDERLATGVVRALCALPRAVQLALTGGPVVGDGQTLEPELQLLLRAMQRARGRRQGSSTKFRAHENKGARIAGGAPVDVGAVREVTLVSGATTLAARHYAPRDATGRAPLLLYLHGGGFVFGDLDTHDAPCRLLCRHAGAHVLAVTYRLAPEHRFPCAVDDARAALRWAHAHAAELGADPARVGVAGDSAGGNLAAVVARLAARDEGPAPVCQILLYPAIDRTRPYRSLTLFADGFLLTREAIDWFDAQYIREPYRGMSDPRFNPLAASDLAGLAPALVVTAGFDPLRDEGEAYGAALAAAGTPTTVRRFASLVHGFANLVGVSRACRAAVVEVAEASRVLLSA